MTDETAALSNYVHRPSYPAYPAGQEWSEWLPFPRSSNVAAARYKLGQPLGVWQVIFGGKERPITKKHPAGGLTPLACYEYGPSPHLSDDDFWRWWQQYASGGSAGIWFQVNVKDFKVLCRQLWTQGA